MEIKEDYIRIIANEHRRRILNILFENRKCRYSELLKLSGFSMGESGRFAYHLKKLLDSGLIKQFPDGRYGLTEQGVNTVRLLREGEDDGSTIISSLEKFSERIDTDRYVLGNLLLSIGEVFLVVGLIFIIQGLLHVPIKIEFFSSNIQLYVSVSKGLLLVIIGAIVLCIGLRVLKRILPELGVMELLIYQKYSLLFVSRSGKLKYYVGLYVVVAVIILAVLSLTLIL